MSAQPGNKTLVLNTHPILALLQCSKIGWCNAAREPISLARNTSRRNPVKKASLSLAAAAAFAIAGATTSFAAELPSYQTSGLPISPVQASLLGATKAEQSQAAPAAGWAHQLSVL